MQSGSAPLRPKTVSHASASDGSPPSVVVYGGFGVPNTGDELILASILDYYITHHPGTHVVVLADNVAVSSAFSEARGHVTWVSELNRYFSGNVMRDPSSIGEVVDRLLATDLGNVFPGSAATVERAFKEAEVFHVAGGGYFHQGFPNTIAQVLYCAFFLERVNPAYRLVFTGLTLGPFDGLPAAVQEDLQLVMRSASLVDLRDERSTSWLQAAGIRFQITCDDAFLAGWSVPPPAHETAPYCLVHLGGDTKRNLPRYKRSLTALAGTIREIASRGLTVVPISFCPVDDDAEAIAQALELTGHSGEIVECSTLGRSRLLHLFRGAKFVIGGRLHVAISGFIAGVPAFTMNLTDAFDRMIAVYGQMGLEDLDTGGDLEQQLLDFVERCLTGRAELPNPLRAIQEPRALKLNALTTVTYAHSDSGLTAASVLNSSRDFPTIDGFPPPQVRARGRNLEVLPGTRISRYAVPVEALPSAEYSPRWGYSHPPIEPLVDWFRKESQAYRQLMGEIRGLEIDHVAVQWDGAQPMVPAWLGGPTEPFDALVHYALVRLNRPRRYIEVGSGMLTLFADLARIDGQFNMDIAIIDANPRPEVKAIANSFLGPALETCDLSIFDGLRRGDVLFIDGSHRSFMNSDVTVFFLDVLPRLAPGVLVHIHDVTLPADYPEWTRRWYWNEQYLLATALLVGADKFRSVLPTAFVSSDSSFQDLFASPPVDLGELGSNTSWVGGGSLWFTLKKRLAPRR